VGPSSAGTEDKMGKALSTFGFQVLPELGRLAEEAYAGLPAEQQTWARSQAETIVAAGQFSEADERTLAASTDAETSTAEEGDRLEVVVRYLALKASAGGSLAGLHGKESLTKFQKELIGRGLNMAD
jgi:hypothetical protein